MTLEISVDVKAFQMSAIADSVETFLNSLYCADDFLFEIHLVVEELLSNVILHGDTSTVELCLSVKDEALTVMVVDSGIAFNPLQHEVQGLEDDFADRQIGGMGIHLVKEMMDSVSYEYRDGKNIVRAIKMLRKKIKEK